MQQKISHNENLNLEMYSERENTILDVRFLGNTYFDFCGTSNKKMGLNNNTIQVDILMGLS